MTERRIIVIIPCRYESSRFAGKPLAPIRGKPMIRHVYERCRGAAEISDVVVATDDPRIRDAVDAFGGRAVMTGADNRSGTDRVADAAERMGLAREDVIINVQGDQPLIHPESIREVAAPFARKADPGMVTLGFRIVDPGEITSPKDVKVVCDRQGRALYFSRSPIPFARDPGTRFDTYKHLGVYAYTREFLETFRHLPGGELEHIEKLEQLRALEHGYPIRVVITAHDSPEVDLPSDITKIEARLPEAADPSGA